MLNPSSFVWRLCLFPLLVILFICCQKRIDSTVLLSKCKNSYDSLACLYSMHAGIDLDSFNVFLADLDSVSKVLFADSLARYTQIEKVMSISDVIFSYRKIVFKPGIELQGGFFPQYAWNRREGSCLSVVMLFMMLSQRVNCASLYPVILPGHIFIRFSDSDTSFNIEPNRKGYSHPDNYYVQSYGVSGNRFYNLANGGINDIEAVMAYNVAHMKLTKGDLNGAENFLRRALEIKPNYPDAAGNLAIVMYKKGNRDSALSILQNLEKEYPDDKKIRMNIELISKEAGAVK